MTASYDKKIKLWSGKTFGLVNCLEGHEGRVMGADILPATRQIVSVAYDRTIKIWKMKGEVAPEEEPEPQQAEPMEE